LNDLSRLSAAILAGGPGTRLRSVVADRPKCLAPVRGRPFVAWILDQLAHAGVRDAVLCTGYMADMMQATLRSSHGPVQLRYSRETSPLGTGGALRQALSMLNSDPVLVLNGDSYCDVDLVAFFNFHDAHAASATLALTQVSDVSRYGHVVVDAQHRVREFVEKSASHDPFAPPLAGWINAGVYLLSRPFIASVPQNIAVSLERETFPSAISAGLHAFRGTGRFIDIGTPDSYAAAEAFFALVSPRP